MASWRLGAGRASQGEPVQAGAGVEIYAKPGEHVRKGQKLLTLHTDEPDRFSRALEALEGGIVIGDSPASARGVILDRIEG